MAHGRAFSEPPSQPIADWVARALGGEGTAALLEAEGVTAAVIDTEGVTTPGLAFGSAQPPIPIASNAAMAQMLLI